MADIIALQDTSTLKLWGTTATPTFSSGKAQVPISSLIRGDDILNEFTDFDTSRPSVLQYTDLWRAPRPGGYDYDTLIAWSVSNTSVDVLFGQIEYSGIVVPVMDIENATIQDLRGEFSAIGIFYNPWTVPADNNSRVGVVFVRQNPPIVDGVPMADIRILYYSSQKYYPRDYLAPYLKVVFDDPYSGGASGGTTGGGGGINTPDLGGDTVGVPALPSVSVTDSGFVSIYTGSQSEIKALADYLWTDLLNVAEVVEALKRLVADPMKLIIGMSIVPSQGLNVGASVPVKVGFFDTGLNLTRLSSQFFTVDCGTIKFNTVCGNTFLDYAPYAKFSIYLPFIGTRSVDANDFVNHEIGVKYNCDALTGNCTCYLTKDGSVMYQYSGSLSVNCPLSSQDFTSTIISAVQMAAAGVGIVASGGTATAGLLASASAGASQIANNPSMLSPNVAHSGAVSGCAGLLGVLKPYVIREAPTYQSTANFNTETGYPSNIYIQLGECSGYTQIQDIHLTGINCTEGELTEIENLLKAGVIL